jgi:hypothetical protein
MVLADLPDPVVDGATTAELRVTTIRLRMAPYARASPRTQNRSFTRSGGFTQSVIFTSWPRAVNKRISRSLGRFRSWPYRGSMFALDSPLEEAGFELLVPLPSRTLRRTVQAGVNA